jgi:hypothetical protein
MPPLLTSPTTQPVGGESSTEIAVVPFGGDNAILTDA